MRLDALMQKLIAGSIDDERYGELASEASAARKREKEERKKLEALEALAEAG